MFRKKLQNFPKKKIKLSAKRPMIMLEIIIGLAMISLTASAIVAVPALSYRKQLFSLYELELERVSENLFSDILLNFKKKHSFESLTKEAETYSLSEQFIEIEDIAKVSFKASYKLWSRSEKESNNHTFFKLIGCKLYLKPNTFSEKFMTVSKKATRFVYSIFIRSSPQRSFIS